MNREGADGRTFGFWVAGLLALLLLVLGAWWLNATPAERVVVTERGASVLAYPPVIDETNFAPSLTVPSSGPTSEVKVLCGLDSQSNLGSPEESQEANKVYDEAIRSAEQTLFNRLAQHPNAQARAVGLYLRAHPLFYRSTDLEDAADQERQACFDSEYKPKNTPECKQARALRVATLDQLAAKSLPDAQALVALAAHSDDPTTYALALHACQWRRDLQVDEGGGCKQLSVARWAQLDPGNMTPWLTLAGQAASTGEWSDAMAHAARAGRSNATAGVVAQWLQTAVDDNVAPMLQTVAGAAAGHLMNDLTMFANHQLTLKNCSAQATQDANRRQLCDSVASAMAAQGDNVLDRQIAAKLGESAGWSAKRTESLRDEAQALLLEMQKLQGDAIHILVARFPRTPAECQAPNALLNLSARWSQVGQVAALREQLAASGKTLEQAVTELQARRAKARAPAPASAPAR